MPDYYKLKLTGCWPSAILKLEGINPIKLNPSEEGDGKRRVLLSGDGRAAEGLREIFGMLGFLFNWPFGPKKEVTMEKTRDIKISAYCDRVYEEFTSMKEKLAGFVREIETMTTTDKETLKPHIMHFEDIAKMLDWKLEILMRVCPVDFTKYGGEEVSRTASILVPEEPLEKVAGGYIGG